MDQGAGGATEAGLTPQPAPEISGGILHAGRGFIGNAGITLIGAAAGALLTMGNEVLAARFLGVSNYGLYALALMFAKSCEIIAEFGVPLSLLHYLPVNLSRGQRGAALGTIVGSLPLPITIGLGFALALWFSGDAVAARVLGQPGAGPFLMVLGFAIPLMVGSDVLGNIARGFGRALPYVVIYNLVPQLCAIAVVISLMIWRGPQLGVVYGRLFGLAIGVALGIIFAWNLVRVHIGRARPILQLRRLYGYALPLGFNLIIAVGLGWTDLFLLGLLTNARLVGTYRGCMQIVLAFDLAANACAAALAPLFTVLIAEGRRAALQETYTSAVRVLTLIALPLLLVIIVNATDLLRVLGPGFSIGAPALLLLGCGQLLKAALSPATVALIIGGRQKLEVANVTVAAVANLVLNLMLIPLFGLAGAALATASTVSCISIIRCLQVRRVFGLRTLDFAPLRVLLVTLPLALTIWAVSMPLGIGPGSGFAALFLRLTIMAALIGGSIWLFCLEAGDRTMLLALARRRGSTAAPTAGAATTSR
jgi:O-antigen/teichoic acid export membrane protein